MLLIEGVKYLPWVYADEKELEEIVIEHYQDIFGPSSIIFGKKKLKTKSGLGTIPDAYVLDLSGNGKFYVVEVELDRHDVFNHIVPQVSRIQNAMSNSDTRKKLVDTIYGVVKDDAALLHQVRQSIGSGEVYLFLNSAINAEFSLVVVIDKRSEVLNEVQNVLRRKMEIVELETFAREGVGMKVHAHFFNTLYQKPTDLERMADIHERYRERMIEPAYPKLGLSGEHVVITLKKIHSPREWGLIPIEPDNRALFPGYKVYFELETDLGKIRTRISAALHGSPPIGEPMEGIRIQGKLLPWFRKHRELRDGSKLRITVLEPGKRYKLNIEEV